MLTFLDDFVNWQEKNHQNGRKKNWTLWKEDYVITLVASKRCEKFTRIELDGLRHLSTIKTFSPYNTIHFSILTMRSLIRSITTFSSPRSKRCQSSSAAPFRSRTMAKRHKEWARRRRSLLILELGSKCALCGSIENLEFDCIKSCGDAHHKYDTSHRMSFYHKQHRLLNLQLLCAKCNNKKAHRERPVQERLDFDSEEWLDTQPSEPPPF